MSRLKKKHMRKVLARIEGRSDDADVIVGTGELRELINEVLESRKEIKRLKDDVDTLCQNMQPELVEELLGDFGE